MMRMGPRAGGRSARQRRTNRTRRLQTERRLRQFARRHGARIVQLRQGRFGAMAGTDVLIGEARIVAWYDEVPEP